MANIVLNNAFGESVTYEGVNQILLKNTSGDYVPFSQAEEKHNGKYVVTVVDYDGTILKQDFLNTGDSFTLPDFPIHDGIVAREWVCPIDIVNNKITIGYSDVTCGISYATSTGLTEVDIELTKATGLTINFKMDGTKDWGDGTSNTETSHTYSNYGSYTIICDGTTMPSFQSTDGLFGQPSYSAQKTSANFVCKNIRWGDNVVVSGGAVNRCYSMETMTFPNSVEFGINNFYFNQSLKAIAVPTSVLARIAFGVDLWNDTSLEYVAIGKSTTKDQNNNYRGCSSLKTVFLDDIITYTGAEWFSSCKSLKNIYFPSGLIEISNNGSAIISGTNFRILDFSRCSQVVVLPSSNRITGINQLTKIVVPDALYDSWITATNWSSLANYIYKASEIYE